MAKWEQACRLFEKASEQMPQNGEPFFYMAYAQEQRGHKEKAILNYQKALSLDLDKNLKEKTFWKITLYYKGTKNWKELLHYSKEFLKLRQHRSIQKLKELAEKNYDPRQAELQAALEEAREHKERGSFKESMRILESILSSYPDNALARWRLVLLKMKKKDFHSASGHLGTLLSSDSRNWQYHYKAAVCNYHLGRYDKAVKHLQRSENFHSKKSRSFQFYKNYMFGNIYLEKGDFKLALKTLGKARKIRKKQGLGLETSLAYAHWHLGNYKEAKSYAQQAIQEKSKQALAFLVLAMCSWQKGKTKEAYRWARSMNSSLKNSSKLQNKYDYSPGFLFLGQEASLEKNWPMALKFYKQVDPKTIQRIRLVQIHAPLQKLAGEFNYDFATCLMRNKQARLALEYYEKAGKKPIVFFKQARCYSFLLEGDQAKKYLLKAVQIEPEFWERAQRDKAFQYLMEQDLDFREFMKQGP